MDSFTWHILSLVRMCLRVPTSCASVPAAAQKGSGKTMRDAVVRAKWDGTALTDVREIFVDNNLMDDSISQTSGIRLLFGTDGNCT